LADSSVSPTLTDEPCPSLSLPPRSLMPSSRWEWRISLTTLAFALIAVLVVLRATSISFVVTWHGDPSFTYGFLILPVAFYLGWRRRQDLLLVHPQPSYWGVISVLASALLWLAGNIGDVRELQQFALIAILDSLVLAIVGPRATRKLLFALAFLFFAVPAGQSLIAPLQEFTGDFAALALRLSGIPVLLEGRVLSVPNGRWEIAEACSGIRYLTASIMLGVLFAGIMYQTWRRRIAFIAIAALVPILANGIRAYGIVLLGYTTNNRLAAGTDHLIYGSVFFSLVTLCLFVIGARWKEPPLPFHDAPPPSPAKLRESQFAYLVLALLCVAIVLAASGVSSMAWNRTPQLEAKGIQIESTGWVQLSSADHDWAPVISTAAESKVFVSGTREVWVYIGRYAPGPGQFQLVESYNALAADSTWHLIASATRMISVGQQRFEIKENSIQRGSEMRLVWIWYSVGKDFTSNPYKTKLLAARNRLARSPEDPSVIAVSASYLYERSQAESTLQRFLEQACFVSAR